MVIFQNRFLQWNTTKTWMNINPYDQRNKYSLKCESQTNSHNGRYSKTQALILGQAISCLENSMCSRVSSSRNLLYWMWFNNLSYRWGSQEICNNCLLVWADVERDHQTVDGSPRCPPSPLCPTLPCSTCLCCQVFPHLSSIGIWNTSVILQHSTHPLPSSCPHTHSFHWD